MASAQTRHAGRHVQRTVNLSSFSTPLATHQDVAAALIICPPADSKPSDPHISPPFDDPPSHTYSLSSLPPIPPPPPSFSRSFRNRSRPIHSLSSSSSLTFPPSSPFSTLWDEDSDSACLQFSPIHPLDHLKTLLSQLASTISALKTTYGHQQAAFNPFNMQRAVCGQESAASADIFAADKIMMEGLERLSYIHVHLSKLPHLQLIAAEADEGKNEAGKSASEIHADGEDKKKERIMLKRYEGIITRFHEEIEEKEAVTAALKETLARSMLQEEKLERRVKALEMALIKDAHV